MNVRSLTTANGTKMEKNLSILEQVVFKFHPLFQKKSIRKIARENPEIFNIGRLVEETMAFLGGYQVLSKEEGYHKDFTDGSESKTASVRKTAYGKQVNSFVGVITNISSRAGILKTGKVRTVIFNPHTRNLHYFLIPGENLKSITTVDSTTGFGKIKFSYNKRKNVFTKINFYEVDSFEKLARG
jgi:hypothetical protein